MVDADHESDCPDISQLKYNKMLDCAAKKGKEMLAIKYLNNRAGRIVKGARAAPLATQQQWGVLRTIAKLDRQDGPFGDDTQALIALSLW